MSWIKFEIATSNKPEVLIIADRLKIDPDAVVGKLLRVWAWFDIHTTDGNAPSVTKTLLNRDVGITNFTELMIEVGWMLESNGTITVSKFENHNGETAKARAQNAKRVGKYRKNTGKNDGVMISYENSNAGVTDLKQNCNAETVTKVTLETTPEKRREEKSERTEETKKDPTIAQCEKLARAEYSPGFQRFWDAYPTKRRLGKKQAYAAWQKAIKTAESEAIIGKAAEYAASDRGQGEYSCMPATWLNQGRWEDDPAAWQDDRQLTTERKPSQPMTFGQLKEKNRNDVFERVFASGKVEAIFDAVERLNGDEGDRAE